MAKLETNVGTGRKEGRNDTKTRALYIDYFLVFINDGPLPSELETSKKSENLLFDLFIIDFSEQFER